MSRQKISPKLVDVLMYAVLIGISIFMILPFVWMLSTSLKPADEIFHIPPIIISKNSTFAAYVYIQKTYDILRILWNTFFIAFSATAIRLFFCAMGGYGFSKFKFPGKNGLFLFLLGTMAIPTIVTTIPVYIIMRDLDWIDKIWPLIIPGAANAFGIFFMRQYISGLSQDLLDAARIDGANEFAIFRRIILPIVSPGLVSLGLIFFMGSWNDYMGPLIYLKSTENFTLPLIISTMVSPAGRTAYDVQMAASVISLIPLLVIFLIFQRRFVEGITAGAVKG